jgi:hypothetical protein
MRPLLVQLAWRQMQQVLLHQQQNSLQQQTLVQMLQALHMLLLTRRL